VKKITVIDDDKHIAKLLESRLSKLDYEVSLWFTMRDAIETLKANPPELAILDVMLGDGLGYQIARGIRKHPLLYKMCILFQSVAGETQDIQHAISNGGDDYLHKPYSSNQLKEKLTNMERLHVRLTRKCPVTGLANVVVMRREVDHRLFREEHIAIVYVFVDGQKVLHAEGEDEREKNVLGLLAEVLTAIIRNQGFYETCLVHAGAGHFLVALRSEDEERYCRAVEDAFKVERERFKALNIDLHTPVPGKSKPAELGGLRIMMRSLSSEDGEYNNAHEMFHELHLSKEGIAIVEGEAG